jgi:hypothetical protein
MRRRPSFGLVKGLKANSAEGRNFCLKRRRGIAIAFKGVEEFQLTQEFV